MSALVELAEDHIRFLLRRSARGYGLTPDEQVTLRAAGYGFTFTTNRRARGAKQ